MDKSRRDGINIVIVWRSRNPEGVILAGLCHPFGVRRSIPISFYINTIPSGLGRAIRKFQTDTLLKNRAGLIYDRGFHAAKEKYFFFRLS